VIGYLIDPPPWTVFFTSGAAVLIILWDVRRQAKVKDVETTTPLDPFKTLKTGFFAFCAVILIGVWAMA
jgi:hypothetical protein